jgi:D-alanine-D-alanine ligase
MEKRNIGVIFGGTSSEHEVSCMSVCNVASQIDTDEWNILLIGITKTGHWVLAESIDSIRDGSWVESEFTAEISPDAEKKCVIVTGPDDTVVDVALDVVFPVLHGKYGEDGTVQGLLELAGIPYVGCGILTSAVCMDKFYTKIIVDRLGIRQAKYVYVKKDELTDIDSVVKKIEPFKMHTKYTDSPLNFSVISAPISAILLFNCSSVK